MSTSTSELSDPSPASTSQFPSNPIPPLTRRHSQPPLPLPHPGLGLRAALLGYLGEVEASIRSRLGGISEEGIIDDSSEGTTALDSDHDENELRYRGPSTSTSLPRINTSGPPQAYSSQDALLSHLSWLREDILASLPPVVFAAPYASREWLRALPARIMAVERGLWGDNNIPGPGSPRITSPTFDKFGESSASVTGGGGSIVEEAIEAARGKVLEMVRGVLPTDEWEGWERLGWEETDKEFSTTRPILSGSTGEIAEEEDEEESNFIFPNRTASAKQAIATRRRTRRSKSLGAVGVRTGTWAELQAGPTETMPKLQRMRTLPMLHQVTAMEDQDDEAEEEWVELEERKEYVQELLSEPVVVEPSPTKKGRGSKRIDPLDPGIAEALVASDDGRRLMKYENLPIDWRNNEHIVTGYRFIPLHAATGPIPLLKSAFQWHNETLNIHSHFIPSMVITLVIPFIMNSTPLPDAQPLDTAVLVLYLVAAISCLFTSAEWHVLSGCASKKWMEWGACVDYVGISWLIAASFGTVVYNAFYCQPKAVLLYCLTNAACGALGSYLPFQKWFNQRRMKPYRIAFFLFLNFAMFAPISQLFWKYGKTKGLAFTSPFLPSIFAYAFGLCFYAFHFPECVWPGKFDRVGHSHQIWHAGIVIAIILHYKAVFQIHGMRYDYSCAVPGAGPPVSAVVGNWWRSFRG